MKTTESSHQEIAREVLDVQALLDRCMGQMELAERCLIRFEQRLQADIEILQQCIETNDDVELAQIAHRVKGSAATVSAAGLTRAATALEDSARNDESADRSGLLADFLGEAQRFVESVKNFRGHNNTRNDFRVHSV